MYESKDDQPLSGAEFAVRMMLHMAAAFSLLLLSIGIGMYGYIHFEGLSRIDAFLNVTMLLGGMGPVNPPLTPDGKLFAGFYALYAGLVFLGVTAIVFAPIAHRILHSFHLDTGD